MADIPASTWSETDANNNTAAPLGFPEGMAPSGVNNGARAVMGAVKRWFNWTIPKTTAGTTTAYTLSYSVAPSALVDGMSHLVQFNATSGASPTLNVNSLGAKPIYYFTGSAWAQVTAAGTLPANMIARVSYNQSDGAYRITSASFSLGAALLSVANTLSATLAMSGAAINEAVRVDVASATTCDIGAAASNYVRITGTTAITGLGTIASGVRRKVVFGGILTLTHNATSLILPTGTNITTAAGDCAEFQSEGSGNWRCTSYQKANGQAVSVVAPAGYVSTDSTGYTLSSSYSTPMTISEGIELFAHNYTARTSGNTILVAVDVATCAGQSTSQVLSIFINSATNAVATAKVQFTNVAFHGGPNRVVYSYVAGGSATTINVRIAGGGTIGTAVFSITEIA